MNSFERKIEASRQKRLKEMKRKEEAKKLHAFEDFLGFIFVVAGVIALYFVLRSFYI